MKPKKILGANEISTILNRLSFQLIEDHNSFENTVLVGIQPRGSLLAKRISKLINNYNKSNDLKIGYLDITFFRDDFRRSEKVLKANSTKLDFSIENQTVVLVDDVLFTGRSIKAAMSSIDTYGRPKSIELLVLIDRRFKREIPIQANYCGAKIDTFKGDRVKVVWGNKLKDNVIYIES